MCSGNREVNPLELQQVDLDLFDYVNCPLCSGTGFNGGEICLACGSKTKMECRQAEWINVRNYAATTCPICEGSGCHIDNISRACPGVEEMERYYVRILDLRQYGIVGFFYARIFTEMAVPTALSLTAGDRC